MRKGEGQKETDGSIRDTPLYCILPKKKLDKLKSVALSKGQSKTDAISEAIDLYLSKYALYIQDSTDI